MVRIDHNCLFCELVHDKTRNNIENTIPTEDDISNDKLLHLFMYFIQIFAESTEFKIKETWKTDKDIFWLNVNTFIDC